VARHRLGIVLLVPEPWATEIDGVRRALGDDALGRIPSHLTLVPPVNVRDDDLAEAFDRVHAAAGACPPLDLRLGPVTTFAPVNPVAYLAVGGPAPTLARLVRLRDELHAGPLDRPADHDFVPHVTVASELPPDRLEASVAVLADYAAEVRFERVHVLAEQPGRIWVPVGDAALGDAPLGRG
jgi:2'-5' RNA ligase